jgi:hypothetical protein
MNSIHFFVLNLDKNKDRLEHISNKFKLLDLSFTRVKAVEGSTMHLDVECQTILEPRLELLHQIFINYTTNEKWEYDGTISKSFPNISLYGNDGTKGLTISNIKAFKFAEKRNENWFCILEDDADINQHSYNTILNYINDVKNLDKDIILLDERHYGWGGCSGMLYNKRIIKQLIEDLHPLSSFSINSHLYGDSNLGNLWDWKMWKYIGHRNISFGQLPCIKSGNFKSTINC